MPRPADIHVVPSPFPFILVQRGVVITDERCRCGALRSEHRDTLGWGHGSCRLTHCAKYTWVANVETRLS